MQVAAWYPGRKTTSGRQTTTSRLTEPQILPSEFTVRKPLNGRNELLVTCDVEYLLLVEPEVLFRSLVDVP